MTRDELVAWMGLEPVRDAAHKAVTDAAWVKLRAEAVARGHELPEEQPSGHPDHLDMIREAVGDDTAALRELLAPVQVSVKAMGDERLEKLLASLDLPVAAGEHWESVIVVQGDVTREIVADLAAAEGVDCRFRQPKGCEDVIAFEIAVEAPADRFIFRAKLAKALGRLA